jgi:hypothetical protein
VKFVKDLYKNKDVLPTSYWANTSSNSIVKSLIERSDTAAKEEIELLIEGKTIEKPVHEDITLEEMLRFIKETHYSHSFIGESDSHQIQDLGFLLLFFTGYLKKISERMSETNQKYVTLEIPNEEIKYIFRTKILKWFYDKVKARDLSKLYSAVIAGDADIFEAELGKLLIETISFNDAYENFYHGFLTGTLANMHDYIVKSNREGGSGRSDLFIKSVSLRGIAIVIELKVAKNIDELEVKAEEAIKQIEVKGYDSELRSEGYKNILKYGISFYRKDCFIIKKEG